MDCRAVKWLVLGFACLWFGMLMPVHQRGQIQLPGGNSSAPAAKSHCHAEGRCHKKNPAKPAEESKRSNCAVCHFIAGLHAPPPVTAVETQHRLTRSAPAQLRISLIPRHSALPFHGLDPPLA